MILEPVQCPSCGSTNTLNTENQVNVNNEVESGGFAYMTGA